MKKYLRLAIFMTIAVAALYFLAVKYNLFYLFSWYDNMMHVLAGTAVGYFGIFLFWRKTKIRCASYTLLLAFLIGSLWELFERIGYLYAPEFIKYGGLVDTAGDIVYAILGALFIIILEKNHV